MVQVFDGVIHVSPQGITLLLFGNEFLELLKLFERSTVEAQVVLHLIQPVDFIMHQSRPFLDRQMATMAVSLRLVKTNGDLREDILPVGQQPVEARKEPADACLVLARLVKLPILVEVAEEELRHYVFGNRQRLGENDGHGDIAVESARAPAALPSAHSKTIMIDARQA